MVKIEVDPVDLWVADTDDKIIARQSDQSQSYSIPIITTANITNLCTLVLLAFDKQTDGTDWTASLLNARLKSLFTDGNKINDIPFKVNKYQLLGLANTTSSVNYYDDGSTPDFYSTLSGSYKVSFTLQSGAVLPSLPTGVLDLFSEKSRSARVYRHQQQSAKSFSVSMVDAEYTTDYMAIVVLHCIKDNEPITLTATGTNSLLNYFEIADKHFFTDIITLGGLIDDTNAIKDLQQFYSITLSGTNQMRLLTV